MTPGDPQGGEALLARAASGIRRQADQRWIETADQVTAAALSATRTSTPIRARAPGGRVWIAEQVLVAYLRQAVDDEVPDAATTAISVRVAGRETFDGVGIHLTARYGTLLLPVADHARAVAARVLTDLLGPVDPEVDVHIADVTRGDPKTTLDQPGTTQ
jgi:hypothetical protein